MADRGIKQAKEGATIESTNPDDYNFWTKYPPLTFLEKKTVNIVIGSSCDLSDPVIEEVLYDWDFIPLVLGTVTKSAGNPIGDNNNRYFMPASDFAGINCDSGLIPICNFNYKVKSDKVEILHTVQCVLMGIQECPLTNQTFTVDLYFYMWELGSVWPL